MQNFIRRLRKKYTASAAELKYIYVSQYGEKKGRAHHHILLSEGLSPDIIRETWQLGTRINVDRIEYTDRGCADLAHYISRDLPRDSDAPEIWRKAWCASRNLCKPVERAPRDGAISKKDVARIADECSDGSVTLFVRERIERLNPGYTLSEVNVSRSSVTGEAYIYAKLYRTDTPLLDRWRNIRRKNEKRL